jgi:hypothetical protein
VRYVPDGSLCTASAEQIFPRDSVQRNCFELALYTTRDHDCISNRIGSGIRNCPRCRCRLATFATPSMIERAIIMLTDHRFWGHASGPHRQVRRSPSFHPLLTAMPLAAAPYRASGLVHWHKADQPIALADVRFRGTSGLGLSTCAAARPSVAVAPFSSGLAPPAHGIGGRGPAPSRGHGVEAGAAPGHRYAY